MSRRDIIHPAVVNALTKDGWTITDDPFYIEFEELTLAVDIGAERTFAARRGEEKIAVEVKSFVKRSPVQDLKDALGQFLLYRGYLNTIEPDRTLYIALPERVYDEFFTQKAVEFAVDLYKVPLIVVNLVSEEIAAWIK